MTKIALDDDIVIAKIKNGTCRFDLGDADLVALGWCLVKGRCSDA